MSNVEFENDFSPRQSSSNSVQFNSTPQYYNQQSEVKGMTGWLMRKGIISDESQAKGILLGIVILNMLLTLLVVYFFVL